MDIKRAVTIGTVIFAEPKNCHSGKYSDNLFKIQQKEKQISRWVSWLLPEKK